MRALLALVLLAGPATAQEASPFAGWSETSGSLPPEYAWNVSVTYFTDGATEVSYCKGYASEPPGCAVERAQLDRDALERLQTSLAPLGAGLLEHLPQPDPMPPVGGGSVSAWLTVEGEDIHLPAFPLAEDKAQVNAILAVLQAATPPGAVDAAARTAKAP